MPLTRESSNAFAHYPEAPWALCQPPSEEVGHPKKKGEKVSRTRPYIKKRRRIYPDGPKSSRKSEEQCSPRNRSVHISRLTNFPWNFLLLARFLWNLRKIYIGCEWNIEFDIKIRHPKNERTFHLELLVPILVRISIRGNKLYGRENSKENLQRKLLERSS